jgi:hypothetical protein
LLSGQKPKAIFSFEYKAITAVYISLAIQNSKNISYSKIT